MTLTSISKFFVLTFIYLSSCLVLLTPCYIFAQNSNINEVSPSSDFQKALEKVDLITSSDPKAALEQLTELSYRIAGQPLAEQMYYYKLLAEVHASNFQFESSLASAERGIELADKLKRPNILIAQLFNFRGFAHESLGDYSSAVKDYKHALGVAQSLNANKSIANSLINLGALYYLTDKFEQSLVMLNEALKITDQLDDEMRGYVNNELGNLYVKLNQNEQAQYYFQRSYDYYLLAEQKLSASNSLYNLSISLIRQEQYDLAVKRLHQVVAEAEEIEAYSLIFYAYLAISSVYEQKEDDNPEAAYEYLLKAEPYLTHLDHYQNPIRLAIDKAYILIKLERYQHALGVVTELERLLAKTQKEFVVNFQFDALRLKAKINFALENYQQAYLANRAYNDLYQSYSDKLNSSAIAELRLKYETQQVDLTNEILQSKKLLQETLLANTEQQASNSRYYLLLILIAVSLLAWLLVKLVYSHKTLLKINQTDILTGVPNRNFILKLAEQAYLYAQQNQQDLTLLVIDVDDFKAVSEELGHRAADKLLKTLAKQLKSSLRQADSFGRYGNEEFLAVLPKTSGQQAGDVVKRLQQDLLALGRRTVSIGVVSYSSVERQPKLEFNQLLKLADERLFEAKRAGKSGVCYE